MMLSWKPPEMAGPGKSGLSAAAGRLPEGTGPACQCGLDAAVPRGTLSPQHVGPLDRKGLIGTIPHSSGDGNDRRKIELGYKREIIQSAVLHQD